MNGRYVGIAIVAVAALCFNYQMFGFFGDVNYRLSAHLALGDLIRLIAAGTAFIV